MSSSLFDLGGPAAPARSTDPETSHEAGQSLPSESLRRNRIATMRVLGIHGRMTHESLIDRYEQRSAIDPETYPPQSPSGLRTRCAELVDEGLVADSGRKTRLRSGRMGVVWEITEAGRNALTAIGATGLWS